MSYTNSSLLHSLQRSNSFIIPRSEEHVNGKFASVVVDERSLWGPGTSNLVVVGAPANKDRKMASTEYLVLDLSNPDLRENALLELSNGGPGASNPAAAGASMNKDKKMALAEHLVLDLSNPDLRENALLELSKVIVPKFFPF